VSKEIAMTNNHERTSEGTDRGWKRHLLSSGIPLEYEVAQILSALGLATEADYAFTRPNGHEIREGSVDLSGHCFEPFGKEEVAYKLGLLIECKYRSPNKTLLLLPSYDSYGITLGRTVTSIDAYSKIHIPMNSFVEFERSFGFVYKGVEVYEGGAIEREFRHGIEQLRYASPYMMRQEIDFQVGSHMDDVIPVFLAKILLTNAPIRILSDGVGLSEIESAKSLEEISYESDGAILHSDYGPDYEEHVKSVFETDKDRRLRMSSIHADHIEIAGKTLSKYSDPSRLIRELNSASGQQCRSMGTQFFVVNLKSLPAFLKNLRIACKDAYRNRTKTDQFLKGMRRDIRRIEQI
jgi:hypothetical protein